MAEAFSLQPQAAQVPSIQLTGWGAGESCTEQDTIFRLNELLKLQVSIAGSLEMACLAFRHADLDLADATRQTFRQARDLFQNAADVVSRYALVAQQVRTTVLPDLRLAVEEQVPSLAIDLLGVVKTWVSDMKRDGEGMRGRYAELQASVLHLAGRAQRTKLNADQRLAEAVQAVELHASVEPHAAQDRDAQPSFALEPMLALNRNTDWDRRLPDMCSSRPGQPGSGPPADAAAAGGLDAAAAGPGAVSVRLSLNSLTRDLFEQLGRLSAPGSQGTAGHAGGDALMLGSAGGDDEAGKQNLLDLLFMAPGITPLTLPALDPLNFTLDPKTGDDVEKEDTAVLSAAGDDMGESSIPGASSPLLRYSQARQEARAAAGTATRSSAALLRALRELRRVDMILQGCSAFWANMDGTVEKLAQMKDVTERLVGFATSSARLRERFEQRLGEYASFWASLERLCRKYILDHHAASTRMQEFVREVADAADLIDTAESARVGAMAAKWERQRRKGSYTAEG